MALLAQVRLALVVCLCSASLVFAATEQKYTLNMQDAEIKEVIDLVAKVTGKTFIIDPRVRGKVTVVSEREMTESQIYETFLATLEVYGFSAVVAGDVVKIIGQSDIKSAGIDVETTGGRVGEDIITRVFPIQNASAMELVPILRPMVAKYGHLAGVPSANVLIVADRATNIERLSEIIDLLDKAGSEEIEVVNLKHAWVGGMITLLERISPAAVVAGNQGARSSSGSNRGVLLVGDERSNRIIIKGESDSRAQIVELIQKLDTPSEENTSYKVIFLNNADAKKMAEILKGIAAPGGAQGGQGEPPSQPVSILADEDQNALIVRAEPSELSELEAIIAQLDVTRSGADRSRHCRGDRQQRRCLGCAMGDQPGAGSRWPAVCLIQFEHRRCIPGAAGDGCGYGGNHRRFGTGCHQSGANGWFPSLGGSLWQHRQLWSDHSSLGIGK